MLQIDTLNLLNIFPAPSLNLLYLFLLQTLKSNLPGLTTCPAGCVMSKSRPSRCLTTKENPHRASVKEMDCVMKRSSPDRWNLSCGFNCNTMITSPGSKSGYTTNQTKP